MSAKLSKPLALYLLTNPPSLFWIYKCASCRFFLPDQRKCQVVSEEGPPRPGEINPEDWCLFWLNREGDAPFSWISRVINGERDPWEVRP